MEFVQVLSQSSAGPMQSSANSGGWNPKSISDLFRRSPIEVRLNDDLAQGPLEQEHGSDNALLFRETFGAIERLGTRGNLLAESTASFTTSTIERETTQDSREPRAQVDRLVRRTLQRDDPGILRQIIRDALVPDQGAGQAAHEGLVLEELDAQ